MQHINDEVLQEIRSSWRDVYPKDRQGKGIICPLCQNGSGSTGDGVKEIPGKPGRLKCFKCGFSGDVIDLVMNERGLSFMAAVESIAGMLGINIPADDSWRHNNDVRNTPVPAPAIAAAATRQASIQQEKEQDYSEYIAACMERLHDQEAASYLQSRGISMDTAEKLYLGYDPAWVSPSVVKAKQAAGNEWRPAPTKRIIIPSVNPDWTVSHYVARAVSNDVQKQYSKMNEGRAGLFNMAALDAAGSDTVFITEGAMDAASIVEVGGNAIALNSTSNVDKLLKHLEEHGTGAVVAVCLDNDEAGKKAAGILMDGLKRLNIKYVQPNICGSAKDPNEALQKDREAFRKTIRQVIVNMSSRPHNVAAYIRDIMPGEMNRYREAGKKKTGFDNLDEKTKGLYSGLYVIGAISSLGKTTFTHQIADSMAMAGCDVIYFSMEQSKLDLVSKSIAREYAKKNGTQTGVNSLMIREGFSSQGIENAIQDYCNSIENRMSIVEGNFRVTVDSICDYVRKYVARNNIRPVVFIDYLQILQGKADQGRQNQRDVVDSAVTELRRLSRDLDLIIFVISSLNRSNYLAPVDFESFKESGGIEYTADVVWGLQLQCLNEEVFSSKEKITEKRNRVKEAKAATPRRIELVCLKNRFGISSYNCFFDYYPHCDLFMAAQEKERDGSIDWSKWEDVPMD